MSSSKRPAPSSSPSSHALSATAVVFFVPLPRHGPVPELVSPQRPRRRPRGWRRSLPAPAGTCPSNCLPLSRRFSLYRRSASGKRPEIGRRRRRQPLLVAGELGGTAPRRGKRESTSTEVSGTREASRRRSRWRSLPLLFFPSPLSSSLCFFRTSFSDQYACRKTLSEVRPRVRGRFARKVGVGPPPCAAAGGRRRRTSFTPVTKNYGPISSAFYPWTAPTIRTSHRGPPIEPPSPSSSSCAPPPSMLCFHGNPDGEEEDPDVSKTTSRRIRLFLWASSGSSQPTNGGPNWRARPKHEKPRSGSWAPHSDRNRVWDAPLIEAQFDSADLNTRSPK